MNATIELTDTQIKSLLCGAFEGGSNYWYHIERYAFTTGLAYSDFRKKGKCTDPAEYWHPSQLIPMTEGCAAIITADGDPEEFILNREAIQKGIGVMAKDYPENFADIVAENDDADTADVFLQCCLFGKVIYG